jgi:hypothetical protein
MEFMMKVSQLFTVNGFTQALTAHHANLHKNYNFPPLSGKKPIHKFAEAFEHKSAEPFLAELKHIESSFLKTSVNLSNGSRSQILHIEVDEEMGEHKVRVMFDCEPQFVICDINPTDICPAVVSYENSKAATVFFGAVAVRLIMETDGIIATVLETDNGSLFDTNIMPFVSQNIMSRDEQFEPFESAKEKSLDELMFNDKDRDELMESFDDAMARVSSYDTLRDTPKEEFIPFTSIDSIKEHFSISNEVEMGETSFVKCIKHEIFVRENEDSAVTLQIGDLIGTVFLINVDIAKRADAILEKMQKFMEFGDHIGLITLSLVTIDNEGYRLYGEPSEDIGDSGNEIEPFEINAETIDELLEHL